MKHVWETCVYIYKKLLRIFDSKSSWKDRKVTCFEKDLMNRNGSIFENQISLGVLDRQKILWQAVEIVSQRPSTKVFMFLHNFCYLLHLRDRDHRIVSCFHI